jgi:WD40 repeat protein
MNDYKDKFTKAHKKILTGHKKRVYTIEWLVNTNTILTGSVDTTIRSWDISNDSFTEFKCHS